MNSCIKDLEYLHPWLLPYGIAYCLLPSAFGACALLYGTRIVCRGIGLTGFMEWKGESEKPATAKESPANSTITIIQSISHPNLPSCRSPESLSHWSQLSYHFLASGIHHSRLHPTSTADIYHVDGFQRICSRSPSFHTYNILAAEL